MTELITVAFHLSACDAMQDRTVLREATTTAMYRNNI